MNREINLVCHDMMVEVVENMPKTHFWDRLPIRKGLAKLIPHRLYIWAWKRKYPDG